MKTIKRIGVRATRVRVADSDLHGTVVSNSRTVVAIGAQLIGTEDQEVMLSFALDTKNRILGYTEVARGGLNCASVLGREMYRAAVLIGAAAIVIVHNHPSGSAAPSAEDTAVTERLVQAGLLLGIEVVDHVIVAQGGGSFSYLDAGLLPKPQRYSTKEIQQ